MPSIQVLNMQGASVGEMFSIDPQDTTATFNPFSAADEFVGGAVVGGLLGAVRLHVVDHLLGGEHDGLSRRDAVIDLGVSLHVRAGRGPP